jgi:hypothetical protein
VFNGDVVTPSGYDYIELMVLPLRGIPTIAILNSAGSPERGYGDKMILVLKLESHNELNTTWRCNSGLFHREDGPAKSWYYAYDGRERVIKQWWVNGDYVAMRNGILLAVGLKG